MSMEIKEPPPSTRRWEISKPMAVFWIMFLISFLKSLDRNVLTGAANVVAHELGFGFDGIGYIASAFLVVYTLATVPLGIWADRAKRKNVVAICVAIWSLATAFTALATNFITLFLSRMVLGIGEAGYFPACTALMSDYFSRTKRSRIMSWWSVGQLVGILVGFVIGGELAGIFIGSWRLAFVFTGIPGLFLAFLAWKLREPRRNEADEEEIVLYPYTLGEVAEIEEPPRTIHVSSNVVSQLGTLLRIKTLVVFIIFFVLTTILLTIYTGPSTAATQDVVPSVLRASAVAVSLLIAHLLGDAFAPTLVGVLAKAFDPTHGLHFANNMGGQDLARALLFTCTPALIIAGLVGTFGAHWMKVDVSAARQADKMVCA